MTQRHFSMLRDFLADWFTVGERGHGTGAIFASMRFLQDGRDVRDLLVGMALIPLAFVFDASTGASPAGARSPARWAASWTRWPT